MTGLIAGTCCCGYEGENMFEISDRLGHIILSAHEDSNCCARQCCERLRAFEINIKDRQSQKVIRITRPQRCDNCICFPCLNQVRFSVANFYYFLINLKVGNTGKIALFQEMEVECPPGNVVGSVEQNINCYRPTLDINDQNGDVQYVIEGPSSCKTFCKGIIQMGIFKLPSKYQYVQ